MPRPMPLATVAGAGYIALDILLTSRPNQHIRRRAGGTCGNVLAILSFLGHASAPIARLGEDKAANSIISDLRSTGVDCRYVHLDPSGRTPRVIEYLPKRPGGTHRFAFTCPLCQRRFPRRTEPLFELGSESIQQVKPALFFFDRSGPTTIKLATAARKAGAMVMFEPDSFRSNANFNAALHLSDIVKYSVRRTGQSIEPWLQTAVHKPRLVVETMGGNGLRYMTRSGLDNLLWKHQEPFVVDNPTDQAGAGDWCSAGLISRLLHTSAPERWRNRTIGRALAFGQALAAASIHFEGPRGYVEKSTRQEVLRTSISALRQGKLPVWIHNKSELPSESVDLTGISEVCALCLVPAYDQ